jgi:hypothetical protein
MPNVGSVSCCPFGFLYPLCIIQIIANV